MRPAAADQLQSAQAQAAQIASQIQAQGEQLAVLSERYDQDQIHVQQLDQQLTQTQAQIALTKAQVTSAQEDLRSLAVSDYTSGGSEAGLEQLFTPGGERSAAVQEYQQVASESVSGAIDRLNRSESVLSAQEGQLQTTQSQAQATLAAAQSARQGAQAELANQQATLSKVKGNIATLVAQQQAAQAAAQAAAFRARLAAQQAAAARGPIPATACRPSRPCRAEAEPKPWPPPSPDRRPLRVGGGDTRRQASTARGSPCGHGRTPVCRCRHSAAAQYDETVHVPLSDLQPGDLLFYDEGGIIGHVTMYIGPGEMVQAEETGTNIQVHRDLDERSRRRRTPLTGSTARGLRVRLRLGGAGWPESASHSGGILPSTPGARGPGGRPKRYGTASRPSWTTTA